MNKKDLKNNIQGLDENLILNYLENNLKLDLEKIKEEETRIQNINWEEVIITLPIEPKPSPRPRYSFKTKHFYVKGAKSNKNIIKEYINSNIIYTRTNLLVKTYQPTPIHLMDNNEIYLAEKELILPIQNPDWDNLGKTYSDMIQEYLILNDNIVNPGSVEKYYSLIPRVVIIIRYQKDFDSKFNKKKILNSTQYKSLIGRNE
jgi:Holliday junction resolvase RusA-like endonuclease